MDILKKTPDSGNTTSKTPDSGRGGVTKKTLLTLFLCFLSHCSGDGVLSQNHEFPPVKSNKNHETVVNTSEKSITPPLQKNSDNKRISSPQTVQQIAQKFIQEVVDTIQTNQYNPDPVIEQCFKRLGLIAIGDAKDPHCRDYKVSFKISQEDLQKYPGLAAYYDSEKKEITIQMKVLLSILCAGKDPYIYMEDSNNVNEIIKSIIANGMLKKYPNDIAMGINWRLLLHSSNLTQHDILKIDMNKIPSLYFVDLVQNYCEKNLTVQPFFIETCLNKIKINTLTTGEKMSLLEKYAMMFRGGQWSFNFLNAFEKFIKTIFPLSAYCFKGEINENTMGKTEMTFGSTHLYYYLDALINASIADPENKEKYNEEIQRLLAVYYNLIKELQPQP